MCLKMDALENSLIVATRKLNIASNFYNKEKYFGGYIDTCKFVINYNSFVIISFVIYVHLFNLRIKLWPFQ